MHFNVVGWDDLDGAAAFWGGQSASARRGRIDDARLKFMVRFVGD